MQEGGGSRFVGDIFAGSASVFILLGRTSEINSPKNKTCVFESKLDIPALDVLPR